MEILTENGLLTAWLLDYGSIVLFGLLIAGIIAFPVPEETLLVISGIFMHSGHLDVSHTMLAAYGGSICGITASYYLGKTLGFYFVHKYGPWVGMTEKRLLIAHQWFEKYGTWMLFIGYFIPGVRHFTGFFAGTTHLKFKEFALYAYTGAVVWVSLFLSVGYFFGSQWHVIAEHMELGVEYLVLIPILIAIAFLIFIIKKRYSQSLNN